MGRYRKITRKKIKPESMMQIDQATATRFITESAGQLMLVAGGIILLMAMVSGVYYYQSVTFDDAYYRLAQTTNNIPDGDITTAQSKEAAEKLEKMITNGGPEPVIALAHLERGSMLFQSEQYDEAIAEFGNLAKQVGDKSLLHDIALASQARALIQAAKYDEAETALLTLSKRKSAYPKADALLALAFIYASTGRAGEATAMLATIRNDYGSIASTDYLDDVETRINAGQFKDILSASFISMPEEPKPTDKTDADTSADTTKIHGG